jgi:hypothetical protein
VVSSENQATYLEQLLLDPDDELKVVLARAFDRAWERYYRPGRVRLSPDIARPALASHLVQRARHGVTDEDELAAAGVVHLFSITREDPAI